jgi:hypothetical protein
LSKTLLALTKEKLDDMRFFKDKIEEYEQPLQFLINFNTSDFDSSLMVDLIINHFDNNIYKNKMTVKLFEIDELRIK